MARNHRPAPPMLLPGYSVRSTTRDNTADPVLGDHERGELVIGELREGELAVGCWGISHSSAPLGVPLFNADACERLATELSKRAEVLRAAEQRAAAEHRGLGDDD